MGKLRNIEWKNIFYMICYCVEELEYFDDSDIDYEDIEGTHDLLAKLLVKSFEQVVKNGYLLRFVRNEIVTDRPHGNIDIVKSYKTGSYARGRLSCDVNEININIELNQIVKAAFNILIDINRRLDKKISDDLVQKLNYYRTFLRDVDNKSITKEMLDKINMKKVPKWYIPSVVVAKLILNEYIAIDEEENIRLLELNDHTRLCRIWEKFVRRYIRDTFSNKKYEVSRPVYTFMRKQRIFDVCIINNETDKALIIDTKWYEYSKHSTQNDDQINMYCMLLKQDKKHLDITGCILYGGDNETKQLDYAGPTEEAYWAQAVEQFNVNDSFDNIKNNLFNLVYKYT